MRATGIIRKIDELGRVVIPKEIRQSLKLKEGSSMEILVDEDEIVFKRYSPLYEFSELSKVCCDILSDTFSSPIIIFDTEKIIASKNISKKILSEQLIDSNFFNIVYKKQIITIDNNIFDIPQTPYGKILVLPIEYMSEVFGGILILKNNDFTEQEILQAKIISKFVAMLLN